MANSPGKINKSKERVYGYSGTAIALLPLAVRAIDWFGREQTVMALVPYIHYLDTGIGRMVVLGIAIVLLVLATKFEREREEEETPRIIQPYQRSSDPPKPRHKLIWVKCVVGLWVTLFLYEGVVALVRHRHQNRTTQIGLLQKNIPPLPKAKVVTPVPPAVGKHTVKTSVPQVKPTTVPPPAQPAQTTQPSPKLPLQTPPPPNSGCPKESGKMTSEWSMNTDSLGMMGGLNLAYQLNQAIVNSFYALLKQSVGASARRLTHAQLVKAINLSDDVESHLPKPAPIPIEGKQIYPDITLSSIRRSFLQNPEYLQYSYTARLPSGQGVGDISDKLPIQSLSPESQRTIAEFDQLTKQWGDESCRDAVTRLTKQ